jgi:hypothetical protein
MLDKIYRLKKSLRAISSRYSNFVFMFYFVLGLLIIFMDNFPLIWQWNIDGPWITSYGVFCLRGVRLINDNRD